MGSSSGRPASIPLDALLKAVIGYGGMALCITLVYLGMRAVMDIGGSCADGGPYVSAASCPEGSTVALLGGIFLGLVFTGIATVGGMGVGGIWSAAPLFAWSGLFGALGWNFLDYGVVNAPAETGLDVGWAICGVLFWVMASGPLLGAIPALRSRSSRPAGSSTGSSAGSSTGANGLPGPGRPSRRPIVISTSGSPVTVTQDGHTITYSGTVVDGELPEAMRSQIEALERRLGEATAAPPTEANREPLARIAADFGAVIGSAMAETPVDPAARPATAPATPVEAASRVEPEPEFTEGTQALLDRLERLADMRDRGLLGADEYETAKAAIMAELEGRK